MKFTMRSAWGRISLGLSIATVLGGIQNAKGWEEQIALPKEGIDSLQDKLGGLSWNKWKTSPLGEWGKAFQDLERIKSVPKIRDLLSDQNHSLMLFQKVGVVGDEIETTKFQHYYKGLEVIGSAAHHHTSKFGSWLTNWVTPLDVSITPGISVQDAVAVAKSRIGDRALLKLPELKILPSENDDASATLIYWVKLDEDAQSLDGGHDLMIDAQSGKMIADIPHHQTISPVQVYSAKAQGSQCQQIDPTDGYPVFLNPKGCKWVVKNTTPVQGVDQTTINALRNAKQVLGYFETVHRRASFDNLGSHSVSVVHAGRGFANAYWDSQKKIMAYGDGDGIEMGDFTLSADVAGHEMTHGVVSSTANLMYVGESGATNEAFADYFGIQTSGAASWDIGADLFLNNTGKKVALRSLSNPAKFKYQYLTSFGTVASKPYPVTVAQKFAPLEMCDGGNDYCGVHINSTIMGHAMYQTHQAVGADAARKIFYAALTQYMTPRTNFKGVKKAVTYACDQLYKNTPGTCLKLAQSFAKVGL